MNRSKLTTPTLLLGTTVAVAVVGYNLWSLCCSRCTVRHLMTFDGFSLGLIALNLAALSLLLLLRRRRYRKEASRDCRCGAVFQPGWSFCPRCGAAAGGGSERGERR